MTRQEALQAAGKIITKMAESLAKTGMHTVRESELTKIAEALKS